MKDCIFCKIINGELESKKVYEDDFVLAFANINPVSPGHTLVVPKEHCENILDISKESLEKVIEVSRELSKKLKADLSASGINVLHAAGKDAQQSVFHFHIHLVPRYPDDTLDLWFKEGIEKKIDKDIFEKEKSMCHNLYHKNGGHCNWGECDNCGVIPLLHKLDNGEICDNEADVKALKNSILE
jgi:histidine triad (HIT) family protein